MMGVARQLQRAGTSPGAHFREALRARSKAEYVSKMNGGLMELEETLYWLEIVEEAGLVSPNKLQAIKIEANELIAIFVSSLTSGDPNHDEHFCLLLSAFCFLHVNEVHTFPIKQIRSEKKSEAHIGGCSSHWCLGVFCS